MGVFAHNLQQNTSKNKQIEFLIARIADGQEEALGALYDLIKTDVYAYALSKVTSVYDAEDVMQDTFVQIYKNAKTYTPKGKPLAWILTIELNLIRRMFQLKSRVTDLEEVAIVADSASLEKKVVNGIYIESLLKTLSDEEKEIVTLHVVNGFKHREIAKFMKKPLSTILSKYNRAIKKLQNAVEED